MKKVEDNITESWLCVDCGMNTAPRMPDGPTIRAEILLKGKSACQVDDNSEVYMVRNLVWAKAGMKGWDGCLCIGCLEKRLGRKLKPQDFAPDHAFNKKWFPGTPRLRDRRGY
jgi:hypothetical protein